MAKQGSNKSRKQTPLGIIALLIGFTETVLGVAATQLKGTPQLIVVIFVIAFPFFTALGYFVMLYLNPLAFHPPSEFPEKLLDKYINAIGKRFENAPKENLENRKPQKLEYRDDLILYLVNKDLVNGRVQEVIEMFTLFGDKELNIDLALVRATISRISGKGDAVKRLREFKEYQFEYYKVAQYEIALIRYARGEKYRS